MPLVSIGPLGYGCDIFVESFSWQLSFFCSPPQKAATPRSMPGTSTGESSLGAGLELLLFHGPFSLRRPSCFFFAHQEVIFRKPSRVGLSIRSAVEWILFNFPIPWYWRWGVSVLVIILTALIHLFYSCYISFVPIVHSWAFSVQKRRSWHPVPSLHRK